MILRFNVSKNVREIGLIFNNLLPEAHMKMNYRVLTVLALHGAILFYKIAKLNCKYVAHPDLQVGWEEFGGSFSFDHVSGIAFHLYLFCLCIFVDISMVFFISLNN